MRTLSLEVIMLSILLVMACLVMSSIPSQAEIRDNIIKIMQK